MKVAYVLGRFPVVSETFVAGEIRAMEELGHEVRVFALGEGDDEGRGLLGGLRAPVSVLARERTARALARIAAFAIARPWATLRGLIGARRLGGWREARQLVRALSWAWDPWLSSADRIHAHFASEPARVAHRLHVATGVPFGVTAHAVDLFPLAADVARRLAHASWFVTVCDYNRACLREAHPELGGEGLHVVPCGVDPERFRRVGRQRPVPPRLVAVGRLVPKKGLIDLVEAARRLRERGLAFEVRIVGDGPERASLEERIRAAALESQVRLLGVLGHEAVRDEIEAATVLVLPAVIAPDGDRDSMPLVLKEAMSLEVPVVATRVAGLPEAVAEDCGRLVPPHDPAALADAVAELLAAPESARDALGRRGRARVVERFDIRALTADFARVLENARGSA